MEKWQLWKGQADRVKRGPCDDGPSAYGIAGGTSGVILQVVAAMRVHPRHVMWGSRDGAIPRFELEGGGGGIPVCIRVS